MEDNLSKLKRVDKFSGGVLVKLKYCKMTNGASVDIILNCNLFKKKNKKALVQFSSLKQKSIRANSHTRLECDT